MKLKAMTVKGIRGFNQKQTLEFASDLTIVYGKNGAGKTSVGEALEWLLYGTTTKRDRGDSISKREYKDSYQNIHYEGPAKPFVELLVDSPDGTQHTLRRELNPDESSQASLDCAQCADFAALGPASQFDRPMILQHTLQDFIHMEPKKRYRALSSMLGLEELVKLRGHVDTLQGQAGYSRDKPIRVLQARMFLEQLKRDSTRYAKARSFRDHLDTGLRSLPQATTVLKALVGEAVGGDVPDHKITELLSATKADKEKAVLDWQSYAAPHPPQDVEKLDETALSDDAKEAQKLIGELESMPSDDELRRKQLVKDFYAKGLQLRAPDDPELCPFCGAPTLTKERVETIEAQAQAPATDEQAPSTSLRQYAAFAGKLKAKLSKASDVLPNLPGEEEQTTLRKIVPSDAVRQLNAYLGTFPSIQKRKVSLQGSREQTEEALNHLWQRMERTIPEDDTSSELPVRIIAFAAQLKDAFAATHTYRVAYDALAPTVQQAISTQEAVGYLTFLTTAWTGWPSVEIALHDIRLEESLLEFRRQVMSFIKSKQEQIIQTREQDIKNWYNLLNPQEPVTFSGIQVATDALRLIAESYGRSMEAAPNLSCSHLNCVGLAVYLACATRQPCPFRFLFIDDPVQSMDEDHMQAFVVTVLQRLLDERYQVILLTHLHRFAEDIHTRYRAKCNLYRLDFVEYSNIGPVIKESLPSLESYLKEAREKMEASNKDYRAVAVMSLRKFVERFVRDLYARQTGNPISGHFKKANWSELRKLLLHCKDFEPGDENRLQHTHSFTSRHMHENDSTPQAVPQPHQIRPHVEDMESLLQDYRDKLGL